MSGGLEIYLTDQQFRVIIGAKPLLGTFEITMFYVREFDKGETAFAVLALCHVLIFAV